VVLHLPLDSQGSKGGVCVALVPYGGRRDRRVHGDAQGVARAVGTGRILEGREPGWKNDRTDRDGNYVAVLRSGRWIASPASW